MESISSVITNFLSKSSNISVSSINLDTKIVGSGLFSSLTMVELVMAIENQFNLEIPPEDLTEENFSTVGILSGYVANLKSRISSPSEEVA